MLPSTKKFLIKAHQYFDELGYHPNSQDISFDELQRLSINTFNHTKSLSDSKNVALMIQFLTKNFSKIYSKIRKHFDFWKEIPYEGNEMVSLVSDDEACGTYLFSNAFNSDYDEVLITSQCYGDDIAFRFFYEGGMYHFDDEDYQYVLRYSKLASEKMVLLNNKKEKLCILALSKNGDIFLENNHTDYEIVLYEAGMGVYRKKYIDSLRGKEPNADKLCAWIEWDLLEKKSQFGVARLDLFDENADEELLFIFSMSCFLLYRHYLKASNIRMLATVSMATTLGRR